MKQKICNACGQEKDLPNLELFPFYGRDSGYLYIVCRDCLKSSTHETAQNGRSTLETWQDFLEGTVFIWYKGVCNDCKTPLTKKETYLLLDWMVDKEDSNRCKKCYWNYFAKDDESLRWE